jgi:uncharacterized protein (TIGR02466 family)
MSVHGYFSTPIYENIITGDELIAVQEELDKVVADLKASDSFKHNEQWLPNTHKLSDISFKSNLLLDYQTTNFVEALKFNVFEYMRMLDVPVYKIQEFKITQSWMTNTGPGEFAHTHNHGSVDVAGVYYYKTNGRDGNINFLNPVAQFTTYLLEHLPNNVSYEPMVGKFILFPGWIDHKVPTNYTDGERISISFNINFKRPEFS